MALDRQYLEQLILDRIEESNSLEYKGPAAFDRTNQAKTEITKDVSAFANAAGGTIIYGMQEFSDAEKRHLPERISPIDRKKFSAEWVDQITSLIQPKIEGLRIESVHVGPGTTDHCYVIQIPQGTTAHQALDLRYYRRRNFESTPMEDYEIRDVMNRRKHPVVSVQIRIIESRQHDRDSAIVVRVANESDVLANFYRVIVQLPVRLASGGIMPEDSKYREIDGVAWWDLIVSTSLRRTPLFPHCTLVHETKFKRGLTITSNGGPALQTLKQIKIIVYADEMRPITLTKEIADAEKEFV